MSEREGSDEWWDVKYESSISAAMILRAYGPRLTLRDIAHVLKLSEETIKKQQQKGVLPFPTYLASGRRYADYREIAAYIDRCAVYAREEADAERERLERLTNLPPRRRGGRPKKPEPEGAQ